MAIPHGFIQELLTRVDVVDVVGRYVQLKKAGANMQGLCPFHGEKTPSFTVSPSKQFYHCFGCGKSGDAINFLMEHNGMSFVDAVQELAQQCGLQVPDDHASPQERARAEARRQQQATLADVQEKAAASYKKQLKASPRAIDYLKQRGLSGEIAARYGLGYAPPGWRHLSTVFADYTDPLLEESGLVIHHGEDAANRPERQQGQPGQEDKRYDRFRDRIMFPIRNVKGVCIGFGGRVLGDEKPKYLNSPETPLFSKGHELYGLFEARTAMRQHGFALVTEGYMDVVALAQMDFGNAVATLGTACTPEHVRKLFRFTDHVVFSFDGDAAGRRAARKALDAALPHATDTRSVKFLFLPPEHDPDSYIRSYGKEAFAEQIQQALPLSRFVIEAAQEGCDPSSTEGRARMASLAAPMWQALPDGIFKRQLLGELAQLIHLSADELQTMWGGRSAAPASHNTPPAQGRHQGQPSHDPGWPDGYEAPAPYAQGFAPEFAGQQRQSWSSRPSSSGSMRLRGASKHGGHAGNWQRPPERSSRISLHTHADHVLRYLLSDTQAWDWLSPAAHEVLLHQPAPHGAFFAWIESQYLQHGPQPWSALRIALQQPDCADLQALAERLMHSDHRLVEPDQGEFLQNVQALHLQELKQQQAMAYAQRDVALAAQLGEQILQLQQAQRAAGRQNEPS
ncbi:MAG: DNA primase [Brachymonas sp.]|nr:DNA primase [Brachymonas sp.]MDO4794871.1 DNA primase [Brachymonas sp.]